MAKDAAPPSVPVEEQPYPVPDNWRWVRLNTVCAFEHGITFPKDAKESNPRTGNLPCLRTANVQESLTLDNLIYIDESALKQNQNKLVRKDDIIFSSANSRELVGKSVYIDRLPFPMTFGGFVLNIRSQPLIVSKFLFWFLRYEFLTGGFFSKATQTTNIANINTKILGNYAFPLPPLPEQYRIVERLESLFTKLDEARDKAQAVVDGYEYRRATLLRRAFLGALTANWRKENNLTSPWTVSQFGNLIDDVKLGLVRSRKEQFTQEKYFYLKMNNITADGFVDLSGMVYVDATRDEALLFALDYGDFLFNTRNSYELVGKNTVWTTRTCETTLFNNNIMRVRFKKGVNPFFVSYYLHSPEGKHALERLKKNTTNIAAIYAKDLNKTTIPLPPVQEQERIVDILNHMLQTERQTKESAERVLESVGLIKKAVLGRAFRGLLGTNDPTEGALG